MSNNTLRQLGQTGIKITPIGLGCWQFSEGKGGATGFWSPIIWNWNCIAPCLIVV